MTYNELADLLDALAYNYEDGEWGCPHCDGYDGTLKSADGVHASDCPTRLATQVAYELRQSPRDGVQPNP